MNKGGLLIVFLVKLVVGLRKNVSSLGWKAALDIATNGV